MKDFFENLLSNGELQEKVAELQGKIDAYQMSENEANEIIAELKAENDRLKEEIKEVKKYQYEQEYLEKEIETVKVNLDIGKEEARHYLHEAYKFQKCLQEIKAIAESPRECILSEVSCCNICERLDKISHIITKAEEEWK